MTALPTAWDAGTATFASGVGIAPVVVERGWAVIAEQVPHRWPWWSWLLAFLSYVVLGYRFKTLVLNWIVGPLYPVFVLYVLPNAVRVLLGRRPAIRHAMRPIEPAP